MDLQLPEYQEPSARPTAPPESSRESLLDGTCDTERDGYRLDVAECARTAAFLLFLGANYAWLCWSCALFCVPVDARVHNTVQILEDVQAIGAYGTLLVFMTGLHTRARFAYVFNFTRGPWYRRRGFGVVALTAGYPVVYNFIADDIQGFSITSGISSEGLLIVSLAAAVLLPILIFHVHMAWQQGGYRKRGVAAFVLPRLGVYAFFAALFVTAQAAGPMHGGGKWHLHHYLVGWFVSICAAWNHPVSTGLLIAGIGMFLTGLAAYHADPIINSSWHYKSPLVCGEEGGA